MTSALSGKPRILILEDNPDHLRILRDFLSLGNFDLRSTSDCTQALQMIQHEPPDLLIVDPHLGGENCLPLLPVFKKYLRAAKSPALILVMTADVLTIHAEKARLAGADDYLAKPFELAVLKSKITKLLQRNNSSAPSA